METHTPYIGIVESSQTLRELKGLRIEHLSFVFAGPLSGLQRWAIFLVKILHDKR
jgi:hypothetical protein